MKPPTRIVLLGFDGATLDLILPWSQAGELPHLTGLLCRGAWGPLASTVPPASFPAWSTLMTGVNPGRHGIYDFSQRQPGSYEVAFVNASDRGMRSLWRRVSRAGRRVCVLGFPATYPPEPVNGVLVCGFDAPVTTGIDRRCVYPPELYPEIAPYPLSGIQEVRIGPGWHEKAFAQLLRTVQRRTEVALQLLQRERWDLFALHYGESDTVAHHFWAFHDPASPRYDPQGAARYGVAIRTVYQALDRALGQLLGALPENTLVIVLSDHGSGGSGEWVVHLNRWLEQHGWLGFASARGRPRSAGAMRQLGLWLPSTWQEWAFRGPLRRWVDRLESRNRFGGIDWSETAAFSEEVNTLPGIWINLRGREPTGQVQPGESYDRLRGELCAALEAWPHPETGAPLLRRAWRREELYHGPFVDRSPDIVLEPALDRGYSLTFLSSRGQSGPVLRRLAASERQGTKGGSMNGSHRSEGVLILAGAGVRAGVRLDGATLADVAPTILALLGVGLPDLDGRVLEEAFGEGVICPAQEVLSGEEAGPAPCPYADAEAAVVRERLRGLGYRE